MLSNAVISLLSLLSLTVWVMIGCRWTRGEPALEPLPRNSSPWLPIAGSVANIFVGMLLLLKVASLFVTPDTTPTSDQPDVQSSVVFGIFQIMISLALLTGAGRTPLRDCGIHRLHLSRQVRDGILGWAASLAPVFFVLAATSFLRSPETLHPLLKLIQNDLSFSTVVLLLLSAVVVAPIAEELIFRAMLQENLARRIGSTPAIAISSVLFCAVHNFPDSLALLPLAVVLGYVYARRQSVLSVVLIHALFNLLNVLILLLET